MVNLVGAKGSSFESQEIAARAKQSPITINEQLGVTRERIENDVILNTAYAPKSPQTRPNAADKTIDRDESSVRGMNALAERTSVQDARTSRIGRRKKSLFEALGEVEGDSIEQIQRKIAEELDGNSGISLAREVVQRQLEKEERLGVKSTHVQDAALGAFRGEMQEYQFKRKSVGQESVEEPKDVTE